MSDFHAPRDLKWPDVNLTKDERKVSVYIGVAYALTGSASAQEIALALGISKERALRALRFLEFAGVAQKLKGPPDERS